MALGDIIASSVKAQREHNGWNQEQLAEKMNDLGFHWARTTVTEVEGKGRRRQVSVPELLGLSEVFGCGALFLLWDRTEQGADAVPLEVVTGGLTLDRQLDLLSLLVPGNLLVDVLGDLVDRTHKKEVERLQEVFIARAKSMAAELRMTANWVEEKAIAEMSGLTEEDSP